MTIRQMKSYAAQTGYVYQYYFVGKRPALVNEPEAPSTEFVFDVTSDRKTTFAVSIFLPPAALIAWTSKWDRDLSEPEQYAAIKLRLLQAFDEIPDMLHHGRRLRLEPDTLIELLESIGVD